MMQVCYDTVMRLGFLEIGEDGHLMLDVLKTFCVTF